MGHKEHPREVYLKGKISELKQSIELLQALETESDPKYSTAIEMAKASLYHEIYTIHRKLSERNPYNI